MRYVQLDYFVVSETKLGSSCMSAQFMLSDYEVKAIGSRNKYVAGIIKYVRRGVLCKRLKHTDTAISESICSKLTIALTGIRIENEKFFN